MGRGEPPGTPSCEWPQKVLKIFGDTNHAWAYHVTGALRSKGPGPEPPQVPSLSSDFKDSWPSQRAVCQDKICPSILARPDRDLPFLKLLITVIRVSILLTPPHTLCHEWLVF